MRGQKIAAALGLAALAALSGCTSTGGGGGGSSIGETIDNGRFVRSSDTLGTQRRLDVYGGATSPVLPTIGAPGYGK